MPLTEADGAAGVTWQGMVKLGDKWKAGLIVPGFQARSKPALLSLPPEAVIPKKQRRPLIFPNEALSMPNSSDCRDKTNTNNQKINTSDRASGPIRRRSPIQAETRIDRHARSFGCDCPHHSARKVA